MKNELGVSSVVGVVLLLLLVIVASSIMAVVLSTATNEAVDSTPNALFTISNNNQTLYHGGGDVLYKNRLVFYSNGLDITSDIKIDSEKSWATWHTGQAIQLPANHYVANLIIIALDSLGREQLLFKGSDVVSIPLPTYTGPIPTPAPTPTSPPNAEFTWIVATGTDFLKTNLPFPSTTDAYVILSGSQSQVVFKAVENGTDVTYSWSCPGATINNTNIRSPMMTFTTAGSYQVTLTVSNTFSPASSTKTFTILNPGVTTMLWIRQDGWYKYNWVPVYYWKPTFESYNYKGPQFKWIFTVGYDNYWLRNEKFNLKFNLGGSPNSVNFNDFTLDKDKWYHVTGTFESNKNPNIIKMYVDGSLKGTSTTTYTLAYTDEGARYFDETNHFAYSHIRFHEIPFALTPTEILSVYNAEVGLPK